MIGSIFPTNVKVNEAVSVGLFQDQGPHTEAFDRIKYVKYYSGFAVSLLALSKNQGFGYET